MFTRLFLISTLVVLSTAPVFGGDDLRFERSPDPENRQQWSGHSPVFRGRQLPSTRRDGRARWKPVHR